MRQLNVGLRNHFTWADGLNRQFVTRAFFTCSNCFKTITIHERIRSETTWRIKKVTWRWINASWHFNSVKSRMNSTG